MKNQDKPVARISQTAANFEQSLGALHLAQGQAIDLQREFMLRLRDGAESEQLAALQTRISEMNLLVMAIIEKMAGDLDARMPEPHAHATECPESAAVAGHAAQTAASDLLATTG